MQYVSAIDPMLHFEGVGEWPDSFLPAALLAAELQFSKLIVPLVEFFVKLLVVVFIIEGFPYCK